MTDWAGWWIGCGLGVLGFCVMFGLIMLGDSIISGMRSLADALRTDDEDGDDA